VLLVSDPKFNKSGASLVVNTGQIDDPGDTEGTAHFLEHMLFLGTEKYPDVSEYGNFIRSNGGYQNAYTSTDHTNFQFEVRHAAFADALDRFAQFFIAPKFNPDFTGREKNAVHNEAMRHVQNDFRRELNVLRELYTPGSGESKFSTGNKDTLANATPEAVRAFYESHYSADHMALALAGKASLDELEKLARADFSAIPRRPIPAVKREATFLPHKAALRMAFIEPVKEVRQLSMEFPIGPTRPDFASKPDQLVDALPPTRARAGSPSS
jgi:Secreted/periplasmic Zn-dependent peptidases, insulinase-like